MVFYADFGSQLVERGWFPSLRSGLKMAFEKIPALWFFKPDLLRVPFFLLQKLS